MKYLLKLLRNEEAATAVEYAVMLALILTVIIGVIGALGTKTGGLWASMIAAMHAAGVL
jgi:Flp pilus assembly pilin Flp